MKPQLVLLIPSAELNDDTDVFWCVFNSAAEIQGSGHSVLASLQQALAGLFAGGETLVLVPGELVRLAAVQIPSRQLRQIKQALPYMVEEMIADNIEDVHLAIPDGKPGERDEIPVAVVRHSLLIDWLDQLYQHGVRADFLGPDSLAAPWNENGHSFFVWDDRFIYRDAAFNAQAMFRPQLPAFLSLLKEQQASDLIAAVPRYTVYGGVDNQADLQDVASAVRGVLGTEVTVTAYEERGEEVLAAAALRQRDQMINLLQGGYRVQQNPQGEQRWWRVALAAGIGLVAYGVITAASGMWLSWRSQQVEQQTFALYHQLFPQEKRVVNPKRQMLTHLRSQGAVSGGGPLPLLAKAAQALHGNNVHLDELHYRQQQNDLQVQLRTSSLEDLDKIKQALAGAGLGVQINSAVQQGADTLGRMSIRENPS